MAATGVPILMSLVSHYQTQFKTIPNALLMRQTLNHVAEENKESTVAKPLQLQSYKHKDNSPINTRCWPSCRPSRTVWGTAAEGLLSLDGCSQGTRSPCWPGPVSPHWSSLAACHSEQGTDINVKLKIWLAMSLDLTAWEREKERERERERERVVVCVCKHALVCVCVCVCVCACACMQISVSMSVCVCVCVFSYTSLYNECNA